MNELDKATQESIQSILNQLDALPTKDALYLINAWLASHGLLKANMSYKLGYKDARHQAAELTALDSELQSEIMNMRIEDN